MTSASEQLVVSPEKAQNVRSNIGQAVAAHQNGLRSRNIGNRFVVCYGPPSRHLEPPLVLKSTSLFTTFSRQGVFVFGRAFALH
jgi:hypothetical protein